MVIAMIKMNEVTIKDINLPLNLDEFAENFIKINVLSLMDYFLKYDNFSSHAESRDMIVITMLLNFLRQTTLLQEMMNLIAQY